MLAEQEEKSTEKKRPYDLVAHLIGCVDSGGANLSQNTGEKFAKLLRERVVPAVLVDTGPLVALLDRSDPYHLSCQETFSSLDDSLATVWPVVTEVIYMFRAYWQAQHALWEMIQSGAVQILLLGTDDIPRMRELMRKYRDLPMDLADAGLVRVAERERLRRIFTLDRRDFQIYRPSRIGRFAILPSR